MLGDHRPHFLFMQESGITTSTITAIRNDFRAVGYALFAGKEGLAVAIRDGVNAAPIAACECDREHRVQRLAVQIGPERWLISHRHGNAHSAAMRTALDAALANETLSELVIDVGDFNEKPTKDIFAGKFILFPNAPTFRRGIASDPITCIDGAIASPAVGTCKVACLPFDGRSQHCPVIIDCTANPMTHTVRRWIKHSHAPQGWTAELRAKFDDALRQDDIEAAWAVWNRAAGSKTTSFSSTPPQGAWAVGDRGRQLDHLWRRRRQLLAHGQYDYADEILDRITTTIPHYDDD